MTKHLPADTWYCCHPSRKPVFDVGPYPTRDDAIEDGPRDMGLSQGTLFEVGRMVPLVPEITHQLIKLHLLGLVVGIPETKQGRQWLDRIHSAFEGSRTYVGTGAGVALIQALNMTLAGWLTANDLWPAFGTVDDVETATAEGVPQGPRPHPEGAPVPEYHPNLDGPAEPIGLAMPADGVGDDLSRFDNFPPLEIPPPCGFQWRHGGPHTCTLPKGHPSNHEDPSGFCHQNNAEECGKPNGGGRCGQLKGHTGECTPF